MQDVTAIACRGTLTDTNLGQHINEVATNMALFMKYSSQWPAHLVMFSIQRTPFQSETISNCSHHHRGNPACERQLCRSDAVDLEVAEVCPLHHLAREQQQPEHCMAPQLSSGLAPVLEYSSHPEAPHVLQLPPSYHTLCRLAQATLFLPACNGQLSTCMVGGTMQTGGGFHSDAVVMLPVLASRFLTSKPLTGHGIGHDARSRSAGACLPLRRWR